MLTHNRPLNGNVPLKVLSIQKMVGGKLLVPGQNMVTETKDILPLVLFLSY
jgi:hypothetical protein